MYPLSARILVPKVSVRTVANAPSCGAASDATVPQPPFQEDFVLRVRYSIRTFCQDIHPSSIDSFLLYSLNL